jgi:predicted nucleotidyltransferase
VGTRDISAVPPLVRRALESLRTSVGAEHPIELRLFGSYARGEAHEDSDVDVLVIVSDDSIELRTRIYEAAALLFPELGLLVNPMVLARSDYEHRLAGGHPLLLTIVREGIAA